MVRVTKRRRSSSSSSSGALNLVTTQVTTHTLPLASVARLEPLASGARLEPVVPGAPLEPVVPGAPLEPVVPGAPLEPVVPGAPLEPVVPGAPLEPVVPGAPLEPVVPGKPLKPKRLRLIDIAPPNPPEWLSLPPDMSLTRKLSVPGNIMFNRKGLVLFVWEVCKRVLSRLLCTFHCTTLSYSSKCIHILRRRSN